MGGEVGVDFKPKETKGTWRRDGRFEDVQRTRMPHLDHKLSEWAEGPFVVTEANVLHPDTCFSGTLPRMSPRMVPSSWKVLMGIRFSPGHWSGARVPESQTWLGIPALASPVWLSPAPQPCSSSGSSPTARQSEPCTKGARPGGRLVGGHQPPRPHQPKHPDLVHLRDTL